MAAYTYGLSWFLEQQIEDLNDRIDVMISVDAERDRSMEDMVELHVQTVVKIAAHDREIRKNSEFAKKVVILWLEVVETSQTMVRLREVQKGFDSKADYKKHKRQQLKKGGK
jgi:hypothetical protein